MVRQNATDFLNHYVVTMTLGSQAGGQTRALLRRSQAIAEYTSKTVTIMTFGHQPGLQAVRTGLTERGDLTDRVQVWNAWEYLAGLDIQNDTTRPVTTHAGRARSRATTPIASTTVLGGDNEVRLIRQNDDQARVIADQYFRPDGTLLATHQRGRTKNKNEPAVTAFDHSGYPVKQWNDIYDLYLWTIKQSIGHAPSVIIVDSKAFAREIAKRRFNLPHLLVLHQVHSDHLMPGQPRPAGRFKTTRVDAIERSDAFDGLVVLTDRQRQDLHRLIGAHRNMYVVPNMIDSDTLPKPQSHRSTHAGVIVARLSPEKRISDAVHAIALTSRNIPDVRLSIYGRGPREDNLRQTIHKLDLSEIVTLDGYTNTPSDVYGRASFSLLTSTHEGFGLALIESMAAGCLPIAYDVPYGPANIITDGVNGFLVPPGDVSQLAKTITALLQTPESQLAGMRHAAQQRARDYTPRAIAEKWNDAITDAWNHKPAPRYSPSKLVVRSANITTGQNPPQATTITINIEVAAKHVATEEIHAYLILRSTTTTFRRRITGHVTSIKKTGWAHRHYRLHIEFKLIPDTVRLAPGEHADLVVRINYATASHERRLRADQISRDTQLEKNVTIDTTASGNLQISRSPAENKSA